MDIFKIVIDWITNNWGSFMIGTMSLGTIVTTVIFTVKQWFASKIQSTKIADMWGSSQETYKGLKELYDKEREERMLVEAKEAGLKEEVQINKAVQNVMFDVLLKLALSSKLDSDDKIAIVSNVEKIKDMQPKDIVDNIKKETNTMIEGATGIINKGKEAPVKVITDVVDNVQNLLDKYTDKKE